MCFCLLQGPQNHLKPSFSIEKSKNQWPFSFYNLMLVEALQERIINWIFCWLAGFASMHDLFDLHNLCKQHGKCELHNLHVFLWLVCLHELNQSNLTFLKNKLISCMTYIFLISCVFPASNPSLQPFFGKIHVSKNM